MHRFYLPSLDFDHNILRITDHRVVYQASKVLRMKKGSSFHIFDGQKEWLVQIEEMDKRKMKVKLVKEVENKAEPKLSVSLYQAIPKKSALFELVVQKATELGVTQIFPLITERTEKRRMSKFERLKLITIEAAEQCGRLSIPTVRHPVNYDEIIGDMNNGFIAYEYEGIKYLSDYKNDLKKKSEIHIIIGPEGGLSSTEIELAKLAHIKPFSLGERILRTETAAIATLSLVMLN